MPEAPPSSTESFSLSVEAAQAYEETFVPRLFAAWSPHVVDVAGLRAGQRILDVACGTGVVSREAADRIGSRGTIVGLDVNEAMLAVARRLRPDLEWRQGDAAELPFPDDSFDVVLCQATLMFFSDAGRALREMARLVTGDGVVVLQVWDRLDDQPGYRPFAEVAARYAGSDAVDLIGTYFVFGDVEELSALLRSSGLGVSDIRTLSTTMQFDSVDDFVATEVQATPLAERLDEDTYRRILEDTRDELAPFGTGNGVEIPVSGPIVTARKGNA